MSIGHHAGNTGRATVVSPETMYDTVMELGIVPFFENVVPGFSIEERTPPQFWFDGDGAALGPWDWKIECVQSGDIAYGKFLLGGKAAFATVEWYRELMNWRRSLPSCRPSADGEKILEYLVSGGLREMAPLFLYTGAMLSMALVGAILLLIFRKKIVFLPAEEPIEKGKRFKTVYLNIGVALFILFCLGLFVLSILQ